MKQSTNKFVFSLVMTISPVLLFRIPAGTATLNKDPVNSSLAAQTLYVPYLVASPDQYTGLALTDLSQVPATVRIIGRSALGELLYDVDAYFRAELY